MKKFKKPLTWLTVGIMSLSIMIFAFALWSGDITIGGTVNANGKWDVAVADADILEVSKGVQVEQIKDTVIPTYEVSVYPVYIEYVSATGAYRYIVDDTNISEEEITESELSEYTRQFCAYSFKSGEDNGSGNSYTFVLKCNEKGIEVDAAPGTFTTDAFTAIDGGASDGENIGNAIAWVYKGYSTAKAPNPNFKMTYGQAKNYFKDNPIQETLYNAKHTDTTVTYAPVEFSLPGAWAKYSVTVVNNGTVNANLSNLNLGFTGLSDIYSVKTPDIGEDEYLAPGESCTLEFLIYVDENVDGDFTVNDETGGNSFTLTLSYVQDTVEPLPDDLAHSHS